MGFPPLATAFPGIDELGPGCRISPSVTVFRAANPHPDAGIFVGAEVTLFDQVRLLLGAVDRRLVIGARVIINVGSYVSGEGGLVIGDDVIIGAHVRILSAGHAIHGGDPIIARNPITYGEIAIGAGAWIGAGATVLEGVRIGEGAVVGAGSVITRDVPPFAVAVGNPARVANCREGFGSRARGWRRALKRDTE
jgi:galactoside O-acetyltransferase